MNRSDLLIIGAGPGGYETAVKALRQGLTVTLVERDLLGGTCLNRGCIPTKALCRAAEVADTVTEASTFGIEAQPFTIDAEAVFRRKDETVAALREGVATLLRDVNVVRGEARFTGPMTVEVEGETYTADKVIVATGSAPAKLPVPGAEYAITSDEMLSLGRIPASAVIIGGGVIGMEFASILRSLGSEVTVLEFCPEILPPFDAEVAKRLRMSLKKRGINIVTSAQVTAISADREVTYLSKNKEKTVTGEIVLMAVGRRPVIPSGLAEAGVVIERGAVKVDGNFRVAMADGSQPELYAIGDVNARMMLAHVAVAQGEWVIGSERPDLSAVPSAVFTAPECAMVGLTEAQCHQQGLDYRAGRSIFRANGKAMAMGAPDGMVKVIMAADDSRLLGCHIVGPHAADLVAEATLAISNRLTVKDILNTIHAHPTLSEALVLALAE